jgi:hypothetical protein
MLFQKRARFKVARYPVDEEIVMLKQLCDVSSSVGCHCRPAPNFSGRFRLTNAMEMGADHASPITSGVEKMECGWSVGDR